MNDRWKLKTFAICIVADSVVAAAMAGRSASKQPPDPALAALGGGFISGTTRVNRTTLHFVRGGMGPAVFLLLGPSAVPFLIAMCHEPSRLEWVLKASTYRISKAHKHCTQHRAEVEASNSCGCFYCFARSRRPKFRTWVGPKSILDVRETTVQGGRVHIRPENLMNGNKIAIVVLAGALICSLRTAQLLRSLLLILITTVAQSTQLLRLALSSRAALSAEVVFLRKQLASYPEHQISPRKLNAAARFSLVLWSGFFHWREALLIVKPENLIGWHRKGFKLWWRWKSQLGRPRIPDHLRRLIVRMVQENPTWGEERIAAELSGAQNTH